MTRDGTMLGTPYFPRDVQGRRRGRPGHLYQVAVMLHELLTARAYDSEQILGMLRGDARPRPPCEQIAETLGPQLAAFLRRG